MYCNNKFYLPLYIVIINFIYLLEDLLKADHNERFHIYIYIHTHIYIYRERERERERLLNGFFRLARHI